MTPRREDISRIDEDGIYHPPDMNEIIQDTRSYTILGLETLLFTYLEQLEDPVRNRRSKIHSISLSDLYPSVSGTGPIALVPARLNYPLGYPGYREKQEALRYQELGYR